VVQTCLDSEEPVVVPPSYTAVSAEISSERVS